MAPGEFGSKVSTVSTLKQVEVWQVLPKLGDTASFVLHSAEQQSDKLAKPKSSVWLHILLFFASCLLFAMGRGSPSPVFPSGGKLSLSSWDSGLSLTGPMSGAWQARLIRLGLACAGWPDRVCSLPAILYPQPQCVIRITCHVWYITWARLCQLSAKEMWYLFIACVGVPQQGRWMDCTLS